VQLREKERKEMETAKGVDTSRMGVFIGPVISLGRDRWEEPV
jgi:hypothetical protein